MLFAYLLTRVDSAAAGRAYAAYGGIYVGTAVLWLYVAEGVRPDRWDMVGTMLCRRHSGRFLRAASHLAVLVGIKSRHYAGAMQLAGIDLEMLCRGR